MIVIGIREFRYGFQEFSIVKQHKHVFISDLYKERKNLYLLNLIVLFAVFL